MELSTGTRIARKPKDFGDPRTKGLAKDSAYIENTCLPLFYATRHRSEIRTSSVGAKPPGPGRPLSVCWHMCPGWNSRLSHAFLRAPQSPWRYRKARHAGPCNFIACPDKAGKSPVLFNENVLLISKLFQQFLILHHLIWQHLQSKNLTEKWAALGGNPLRIRE